jgi:transposase InsO family protein
MRLAFLERGLVIRRKGVVLELIDRIGDDLHFEEPGTGVLETLSQEAFINDWRDRRIEILKAFSSRKELRYDARQTSLGTATSTVSLDTQYQGDLLRKWEYLLGMYRRALTRGKLEDLRDAIKEVAFELNDSRPPGASTLSKWMKAYEEAGGDLAALISGHSCRKRQKSTEAAHESLVNQVIEQELESRNRKRKRKAYSTYQIKLEEVNSRRVEAGLAPWKRLSESSFQRRVAARNPFDLEEAKSGTQEATRLFGMTLGRLRQGRPLDFVEIDHRRLDAYTIDDELFIPLGRPWLTVIRDRMSGVVLGFFLGFVPPSLESTFGAIRHSLLPHGAINERWPEIESPWPTFGRGQVYVCDRGADYKSVRFRLAIGELQSDAMYNGVRTPWHKGGVEGVMSEFSELMETVPGRTFKPLLTTPGYDPRHHAVVRFSVLCGLLHKWVADVHNARIHPRLLAPRIEIFMNEVRSAPTPLPASLDNLDVTFGTRCQSALTANGLVRQYLTYANEALEEVWQLKGNCPNLAYIAPSNTVREIWVPRPSKPGEHFLVPCIDYEYADGKNAFQHRLIREAADRRLLRSDPLEALRRAEAEIARVIGGEIQRANTNKKSRYARAIGIDSNAAHNGTSPSLSAAIHKFGGVTPPPPQSTPEVDISFTDVRPFAGWHSVQ